MSGKQNADPIPATTYAGFAASGPSEAPASEPELRLSGEARTYAREELRRRTARRRRAPVAAAVGLAIVVVAAAVGFALLYEPKMELAAPSPPPAEPPAAQVAEASLPSTAAPIPPIPQEAPPAEPASIDVQLAEPPVAAPAAAVRPVARTAVAPKTPAPGKPRSSARAAADRAATDRVSALAVLDQEVNKAYVEALRAGAPAGPLAEAQENWVIRRERLQREDPDMAEDLARARIAELHSIAAKDAEEATSGP